MITAFDRLVKDLGNNGQMVTDNGSGQAKAQCPAHADTNPSLSLTAIEDRVLVHCHAGCQAVEIVAALGRSLGDLFDNGKSAGYHYPDGRIVIRKANKAFTQQGNAKGTALYRSDRIGDAATVYVTEGEQDVLAIEKCGGAAVCSAMGAGKARLADWSPLAGKDVIVVADKDEPGRKHALDVVRLLTDVAASVKMVEALVGKDAADHIAAGHGLTEFVKSKTTPPSRRRVQVTWANTITPKPVTWAWRGDLSIDPMHSMDPFNSGDGESMESMGSMESMEPLPGRIPAGTISVAAGPEGVGKSSFGIAVAARSSTGTLPGADYGTPKRVLYAAVEDSWEQTIVPRLMAAGADLKLIGRLDVVTTGDETMTLSLPVDNQELKATIIETGAAWVVFDPLLSLISDTLDSHHEREVRTALDPLAKIADETGAVLLGIAHWNKGSGTDVAARITGSGAFKNVPRSIFGFVRDPDSETGECVMTQAKNSLGRFDLPSLRYRIEGVDIETPTGTANTGRFVVCGESERSVTEILAARKSMPDPADADEDGYTPEQQFIITYLLDIGPPAYEARCGDVFDAARKKGYAEKALIKARNAIKFQIQTRRVGFGKAGGYIWTLNPEGDHILAHQKQANTEGNPA